MKERLPIDKKIEASIYYEADRTCCICTEKGKSVQIHHIDEFPSNNNPANLVVLCLQCHSEVHEKGGFGKRLTKEQIILYKEKWIYRVSKRRDDADRLASIKATTTKDNSDIEMENLDKKTKEYEQELDNNNELDDNDLGLYVFKITEIKSVVLKYAQKKWDSADGSIGIIDQATYGLIDFYEEVLNELSKFYPKKIFGEENSKTYFNKIIAQKFNWHHLRFETSEEFVSRSLPNSFAISSVANELDTMIKEMIEGLNFNRGTFDYLEWEKSWNTEKTILKD